MTTLRPTHYLYLKSPYFSDGVQMLKTTLQELCLVGAVKMETRWVQVDKRRDRQYKRFFFVPGPNFNTYKTNLEAENFLLNPFYNYSELGFAHLKHYLRNQFGKNTHEFKNKFVSKDVTALGLTGFLNLPSSTGRKLKNDLARRISFIDHNIDGLIRDPLKLKNELAAIGLCVILLDKRTLDKLRTVDKEILDIALLNLMPNLVNDEYYMSYWDYSAFDSFSSFDSFDGFDGGGGESGGGGADGDW